MLVAVGATRWNSVNVHTALAAHTRSEVAVGAVSSISVPSHTVRVEHSGGTQFATEKQFIEAGPHKAIHGSSLAYN